jgi:hypothetical protein
MTKTYLIILSAKHNREKVLEFLNQFPSIEYWFHSLPFTIFVNTQLSAQQLAQLIESKFGQEMIFVTEVSNDSWGRLPTDHWTYFKKKNPFNF